jgi:hypothetical protein
MFNRNTLARPMNSNFLVGSKSNLMRAADLPDEIDGDNRGSMAPILT